LKNDNVYLSIAVAVVIGLAQLFLFNWCWAYIAAYSPLPGYVLEAGLRGAPFHLLFFVFDLAVSVALCLPAAYALCKLRPSKLWVYLPFAIIPGLIWEYRLVFTSPSSFANWTLFLPGLFSAIFVLPIAVLVLYYAVFKKRLTTQSR
jgi:hypothetical protein